MKFCFLSFLSSVLYCGSAMANPGYDIILIGGQSNAAGAGLGDWIVDNGTDAVDARIFQIGRYNGDENRVIPATKTITGVRCDMLQHWLQTPSLLEQRRKMSLGVTFARAYVESELAPERQVLIVPAAYGGTSILNWSGDRGAAGWPSLYAAMLSQARVALTKPGENRIVALLWHQGETDIAATISGTYPMSAAMYSAKLQTVFAWVRRDLGKRFPIIAGLFSYPWAAKNQEIVNQFRQTVASVIADDGYGGVVDTMNLEVNYPSLISRDGQIVHFTSAAQVTLGQRYYWVWKGLTSSFTVTAVKHG